MLDLILGIILQYMIFASFSCFLRSVKGHDIVLPDVWLAMIFRLPTKQTLSCGFICCRKKLNKGVLLYIHANFIIALSLALFAFITGIETAVEIRVSCPYDTVEFSWFVIGFY